MCVFNCSVLAALRPRLLLYTQMDEAIILGDTLLHNRFFRTLRHGATLDDPTPLGVEGPLFRDKFRVDDSKIRVA